MMLDAINRARAELPRAQLSKLDVHGYGSALVESGSSYLERVRTDHDVSPRQMRFLMNQQLPEYADDVEPCPTMPDSPTERASTFVNRLSELTGQPLAARLGLSTLAPYVSTLGTMRTHFAWCPVCIKMAALGERKNYLPLLWSIGCVEACPVHSVLLRTRCELCHTRISTSWECEIRFPFLNCPKCKAPLFQETKGVALNAERATPVQLLVANLVGDLVLQLHTELWGSQLQAPDFRQVLDLTKDTGMRSGFNGFVERANISKGTASRLLARKRCSLDVYVRVAVTAGLPLASLLVPNRLQKETCSTSATWSRSNVQKRRTAEDWPKLIELLKDERERAMPCSFSQFCGRHGVDYKLLRAKASDLADLLDATHAAAIERESKEKAKAIADRLIAEAKDMRNAGVFITRRALARRLGEKRNNKVFIAAWALATASSRKDRLGSRALPLDLRRPNRRSP